MPTADAAATASSQGSYPSMLSLQRPEKCDGGGGAASTEQQGQRSRSLLRANSSLRQGSAVPLLPPKLVAEVQGKQGLSTRKNTPLPMFGRRMIESGNAGGVDGATAGSEWNPSLVSLVPDPLASGSPVDLHGRSLFLFSPTNPLRVAAAVIVSHRYFDTFMLFLIALSSISLCVETPDAVNHYELNKVRVGGFYLILGGRGFNFQFVACAWRPRTPSTTTSSTSLPPPPRCWSCSTTW